MEQLIPVSVLTAVLAAWAWFLHRRSKGRIWTSLWTAFSLGALSALFILSGILGYVLSRRARFLADTTRSDTVIWWQVWVGLALVPFAMFLWRRGLRRLTN
jgi:hypothetical protein